MYRKRQARFRAPTRMHLGSMTGQVNRSVSLTPLITLPLKCHEKDTLSGEHSPVPDNTCSKVQPKRLLRELGFGICHGHENSEPFQTVQDIWKLCADPPSTQGSPRVPRLYQTSASCPFVLFFQQILHQMLTWCKISAVSVALVKSCQFK